jgi:flagellar biosynthesis/type III secretory pathway M-ring protein FliF/YscJ
MAIRRAIDAAKARMASLPRGVGVALGLLLMAPAIGLCFVCLRPWSTEEEFLLGGRTFNATELTSVQAAFAKAKLTGAKVDGARVRIPRGQEAAYMAALAETSVLPSDFHLILDKALGQVSPFMPPKQRDELIKNAKQRELSNIIRSMPGIESAAVIYDQRRPAGLSRQEIITASVTIFPAEDGALDRRRVQAIRQLVAKAIAGLKPEDITVIDAGPNGGVTSGGETDESNAYLATLRAYQRQVESTVRTALAFIPHVHVAANVELRSEANPTPRSVTVAVSVPDSYFEETWRDLKRKAEGALSAQPVKSLEEMTKNLKADIEETVASVIPLPDDKTDLAKRVHVGSFPLLSTAEAATTRSAAAALGGAMRYATILASVALAVTGLMMARRRVANAARQSSMTQSRKEPPPPLHSEARVPAWRDTLAELVRENPQSAASVLCGWINSPTQA